MKKHKGVVVSLIAVVVLLGIISAVSITYNFLGGFYYGRVIEYDKVLGEEQTIEILGEGAYVVACNFSGSMITDGNVKQTINVQLEDVEKPLYLRAKFGVNGLKIQNSYMFGFSNWILSADGYLYFNQTVSSNEKIGLCNEIKTTMQMELEGGKNYIMYFVVEASENAWEYDVA